MLSIADLPTLAQDISALYFGGISLACEPDADTYAALLARACEGPAVMLDPNIRPGFITDAPAYRARLDAMIVQTDILKVSDEDLNWLVPEERSLEAKARLMLTLGPSVVILTRSSEGATAFLLSGADISVTAPPVAVVDTVGAGDTFNAGVLAKLLDLGLLSKTISPDLQPDGARQALEHGAKVAAITVSRAGADAPWAAEL